MQNLKELQELTQNLSVLYVEDDASIQQTMARYLEKFFHTVVTASDGLEGLKRFQVQKFDIVITDLSMPKMNGLDMIEQIRNLNEEQSILITTAHSESNYMFTALKAHVDGYVIKPFDFVQLNQELFKIAQKINRFKENTEYKVHLQEMVDSKTSQLQKMVDFQNDNYEKTLFAMVEMIEQRDTYTAGHSKRVAHYCVLIANNMGYSEDDCTLLHQAGILHDIGKIATPDSVLLNPKRLNEIEYILIQEHVAVGFSLLKNIPMFEPLSEIVYSHHERYDGKGYPRGLSKEEILPLARIMIVADAFDAMTTNRIYKARKSIAQAIEELQELSGIQFHPEVVKAAVVALKDISLDDNISQLPKTKIEEERFAYFYKDTLSEVYNQNYLDIVLMKNSFDKNYTHMDMFFLNDFSRYNKDYGWKAGNEVLCEFANVLNTTLEGSTVFRVFGDDFVVMSKSKLDIENLKPLLDAIVEDKTISYRVKNIDLEKQKISKVSQIENV